VEKGRILLPELKVNAPKALFLTVQRRLLEDPSGDFWWWADPEIFSGKGVGWHPNPQLDLSLRAPLRPGEQGACPVELKSSVHYHAAVPSREIRSHFPL